MERPDILHLHSRVPAWAGILACRLLPQATRPHIVTTVHGFYSVNAYSAVMTRGERIIAVSKCIRNYILKNYPHTNANAIRIIPNAIDPASYFNGFTPSQEWREQWYARYPELKDTFTLCLPGRLTRLKGHADLARVLVLLREKGITARAVLVGEARKNKQAYRDELLDTFRKAGVDGQITWTGHRSDLREIISACDVTLSLSSKPESFGKTTLEALALGRPVAGYAHGGVQEQLEEIFPDGLVQANDPFDVAQKLAEWHGNMPSVPAILPGRYMLSGMIDAHLNVYRELAG